MGLDAEDLRALLDFCFPPPSQRPAGALEMSDVAVGHRDELHLVARRRPQRRHAARLQLGVVGMRAERDDPERLAPVPGHPDVLRERQRHDRNDGYGENTLHEIRLAVSAPEVHPSPPANGSRLESTSGQAMRR